MNASINGVTLTLSEPIVDGHCDGCYIFENSLGSDAMSSCGKRFCDECDDGRYDGVWKEVKFVNPRKQDAIVEELRSLLLQRSQTGIDKYGVTLDRTDLKPSEWCQHALEEALDFAGYILRLKKDLEKIEKLAKGELGEN